MLDALTLSRIARFLVIALLAYGLVAIVALLLAERVIFQPPRPSYRADAFPFASIRAGDEAIPVAHLSNDGARYTILFSHPQVDSIIMWGFWDPRHWKKNAVMYREDWSEKPAGKAYRDLVEREWRTHVAGATNAEGTYELRGFLGEYDVSVTVGGRSVTAKAQLAKTAPGQPQQLLVRL